MTMIWDQLHADGVLDRAKAAAAFAAAFGIEAKEVRAVGSAYEVNFAPGTKVVLEMLTMPGEFTNRISVHLHDRFQPKLDRDGLAATIAEKLRVRVLRDDGSPNPYTMVLFHPNQKKEPVSLDVKALDANEALVLAKPERPSKSSLKAVGTLPPKSVPGGRSGELARLRDFYRDNPTPVLPENPDQDQSIRALKESVFTTGVAPTPEQRRAIEQAVARVRDTWPKAQLANDGTTLGTLLKLASLILK
jgi:hypothetical protein